MTVPFDQFLQFEWLLSWPVCRMRFSFSTQPVWFVHGGWPGPCQKPDNTRGCQSVLNVNIPETKTITVKPVITATRP